MKTLYESILDDEDILVNRTKKQLQNPFYIVADVMDDYYKQMPRKSLKTIEKDIQKIFARVFKDLPKGEKLKLYIYDEMITISFENNKLCRDFFELITLRPAEVWHMSTDYYGFDKSAKLAIFFGELFGDIESIQKYGFKTTQEYREWIVQFAKKYDLTQCRKDEAVYYV